MGLTDSIALDEIARRLTEVVPQPLRALGRDLEANFKTVLQAQLAKLDIVTRQDFDVQSAALARAREQLAAIEARLAELEAKTRSP
ncbi:MAG: accessory factor UbiK family protein [Gammaproteobacteria bacterium]|nr:accessory factor UbiK family protein [Gammaproteobacteria bacterium]